MLPLRPEHLLHRQDRQRAVGLSPSENLSGGHRQTCPPCEALPQELPHPLQ